MSIIYQALKKVSQKDSLVTSGEKKSTISKLLVYVLVIVILLGGWGLYRFVFMRVKNEKILIRVKRAAPADRVASVQSSSRSPYTLFGIIYDAQSPTAVINGITVKVNDTIEDARVTRIEPHRVVLFTPEGELVLKLQ